MSGTTELPKPMEGIETVQEPKKRSKPPLEKKKVEYDKTIAAMFEADKYYNSKENENDKLYAQLKIVHELFSKNKGAKEHEKKFGYKVEDFIYQHATKAKGGNLSTRKVTFRDIWDAIRDFSLEVNICYDWDEKTGLPSEYDTDDYYDSDDD